MPDKEFFPYAFARDGLSLGVESFALDADDETDRVDNSNRRISLVNLEAWRTATAKVRVEDPANSLAAVLLEGESASGATTVRVVWKCVGGRSRGSRTLTADGSAWTGELGFDRADCRGAIEMVAIATRSTDAPASPGRASRANERIAESLPFMLIIDDHDALPGGSLANEWRDFAESGVDILVRKQDCIFHLDLANEDRPRLLLNEGVKGLRQAMEIVHNVGRGARVRNAILAGILQPVLVELAVAALEHGVAGEANAVDGWRKGVLMALAARMMSGSPDGIVSGWLDSWRDGGRAPVLGDLTTASQRHVGLERSAVYLIDQIGGGGDE